MAPRKNAQDKQEETSAADTLWEKLESQPIELFALPNQRVSDHVTRETKFNVVYPDDLYLELKTAAVLPALEEVLFTKVSIDKDKTFEITSQGKYTVVKVVPKLS